MKIVHFIEVIDPRDGGPPVVAGRLAAEQARQGHEVLLLTTYDAPVEEGESGVAQAGFGRLNCVNRASLQARSTLHRFGTSAHRRLLDAVRGADVLHSHALWDPIFPRTIEICRRYGVSVCLTPHGQLTPYSLSQKSLKKRIALAVLWRHALRKLHFLHVLTEDERDDVRACGLDVPAAVVPNGVDVDEYCAAGGWSGAAEILPPGASRRYILFLGRIVHQKGPDILCDAFARVAQIVPDVDLVFAGPDYGYTAPLRSQIARLGIESRVHVLGPVFGAAKLALLRNALCLCQPSRNEGFSMSVLEGLACAVPAIISSECHFPDVQESGAGFVVAVSCEQTAAALVSLLSDQRTREVAGQAARKLVVKKYSMPAVAAQLVEHYRATRIGARAAAA